MPRKRNKNSYLKKIRKANDIIFNRSFELSNNGYVIPYSYYSSYRNITYTTADPRIYFNTYSTAANTTATT